MLVWDLSREDDILVASSGIGDDSHREPISKVEWVKDQDAKGAKYKVIQTESMFVFVQTHLLKVPHPQGSHTTWKTWKIHFPGPAIFTKSGNVLENILPVKKST